MSKDDLEYLITQLEEEMQLRAETLEFEEAARIRDKVFELKKRINLLKKEKIWNGFISNFKSICWTES